MFSTTRRKNLIFLETLSTSGRPRSRKRDMATCQGFWFATESSNEPDIKYTFADLSHLSQRVAGFLKHDLGLDKNSRLLVILPKTPEFWLVLLGAIRCGITLTTCTTMLTAKDIQFRLGKFQPDCIIAGSNEMAAVDEVVGNFDCVQHKVAVSKEGARNDWKLFDSLLRNSREHEGDATYAEDPAVVFFTSGTTGPPPRSWSTIRATFLPTCPRHATCTVPSSTTSCGASLTPAGQKVLRDYPVTKLCAPPTVYRALLQQDHSLFQFKSLVDCISAGEPMNPEVMLKWQNLTGIEIREVYGQTETVVLCASPKHHPIKPGSMGIPPRNIHDEKGREVAVGETGLIAVDISSKRPFGLFAGYRDDPERTANVFRNGFYYTGDRASMDVDGYFWFYSRADDVIISAGYRIGPFEVESVLIEHPAVVECAVVASPDPDRGEVVKAFVVLHPDYKSQDLKCLAEELQQYVKKHTAPYKYPRKVEFVDQLPKTISGKILRHLLRDRERRCVFWRRTLEAVKEEKF
ncbi:hypothetical protein MTO96_020471 [Rhipicephalus appendiculatus]